MKRVCASHACKLWRIHLWIIITICTYMTSHSIGPFHPSCFSIPAYPWAWFDDILNRLFSQQNEKPFQKKDCKKRVFFCFELHFSSIMNVQKFWANILTGFLFLEMHYNVFNRTFSNWEMDRKIWANKMKTLLEFFPIYFFLSLHGDDVPFRTLALQKLNSIGILSLIWTS